MKENMPSFLTVSSLNKSFNGIVALSDFSCEFKKREILGLIGPNGAGKSTILKAASGILTLWQGDIKFSGQSIKNNSTSQNINLGITFCPQGKRVFDELSVWDNLEIGGFNLSKHQLKERVDIVLRIFPALKDRLKENAGHLSGGEQQMLALARALIPPTKLLLLDEPSLGLAPNLLATVFNKLVEINKDLGITMLVVEQKVMEVLDISDRVFGLKLGRVFFQGNPADLKKNKEKMKALFL